MADEDTTMKTLTKALLGTGAAAAAMVSAVQPAAARDRHDGISAGDIIAGAVVLGGIAAVAGAIGDNDRDRYGYSYGEQYDRYDRYDRSGYNGYNGYNNPRQAIEQCVYAAEQSAGRYSYGRADVTDIRDVDRTRYGYTVRGRIAVNSSGRGWRNGDPIYGRGWNRDYRGYNSGLRGYDSGSFKCKVEYGRVVDIDFNNIRGL
jgi:hypothetical protein